MIKNNQPISENVEPKFDDEIDLGIIFKFIFRNKILIGFVTILSVILATLYESTLKKVYKGEFQVVLNQKVNGAVNINPSLGSFVGLASDNANDLKTEVGILKSPSVLMPIFDYVLSNKKKDNPNFELVFNGWQKNNFNIFLEPGTSILNISYKDEDKELIIPVLKRITSIYLEYSGRNKRENQELTSKYLRDQIKSFKNKSAESLKIAQEFAIDQDLIYFNNSNSFSLKNSKLENSSDNILLPNVEIESVRVKAANEIRKIDSQIVNIEEIGNDLQKLQYIGANIPEIINEGLTTSLAEIEEELVDKRSKYTEEDPAIIRLVEKRDLLIGLLKKRSIGFLKAKRIETEALMQSAMRPKGVLLKYKELVREAQRDEATLVNLENQFRLNELKSAKFETPWELITRPTLLKGHVTPNKKKIQLLGLLIGLLLGGGVSYFRESRSNKIYRIEKLGELLPSKFIENLSIDDIRSDSMQINFLKEFISINKGNKIGLITSNEMESIITDKLIEVLINKGEEENVKIVSGIEKINLYTDLDIVLFVTKLDLLKINLIIKIRDQLKLFNTEIDGIILIN